MIHLSVIPMTYYKEDLAYFKANTCSWSKTGLHKSFMMNFCRCQFIVLLELFTCIIPSAYYKEIIANIID